jgi:hypothetical protein
VILVARFFADELVHRGGNAWQPAWKISAIRSLLIAEEELLPTMQNVRSAKAVEAKLRE